MKRSIQSNQEVSSTPGKLQLTGGLSGATTKTEYKDDKSEGVESKKESDKKEEGAKPNGGSLFGNLSTGATAGGQTSLFGGQASTSGSLFGSGFKFGTSTTAGGSSVFQTGSLFGGNTSTSGSLFGGISATGGSLFNASTPLFSGQNSLFKTPANEEAKKKEGEEKEGEEDDDNVGKGDGSPPAFQSGENVGFSEASKPIKLNIESRPPEKSPYEKIFNVT